MLRDTLVSDYPQTVDFMLLDNHMWLPFLYPIVLTRSCYSELPAQAVPSCLVGVKPIRVSTYLPSKNLPPSKADEQFVAKRPTSCC